ncbi:MAG: arsenate reductase [Gammaproteobacteria bacterium]|nr:arsenate reductase [Gammaproteobacteria bacterium]
MGVDITVYGIKNCDTVIKACKYLDAQAVNYQFVDFRKNPLSSAMLGEWIKIIGWDALLNKRSTTYRNLSETQKNNVTVELLIEQPTLIKRPVLTSGTSVLVGFKELSYEQFIG